MSMLSCMLPEQFLMEYDYDFVFHLKTKLVQFRHMAKNNVPIVAHSVLEELLRKGSILCVCIQEIKRICGDIIVPLPYLLRGDKPGGDWQSAALRHDSKITSGGYPRHPSPCSPDDERGL